MLKRIIKEFTFFIFIFLTVSCTKDAAESPVTGGSNSITPFIEYKIGANSAVRVDCSEISFEAGPSQIMSGEFASSISTKASFSFSSASKSIK